MTRDSARAQMGMIWLNIALSSSPFVPPLVLASNRLDGSQHKIVGTEAEKGSRLVESFLFRAW